MKQFNFPDRPDNSRIQAIAEHYGYEADVDAVHLYLELQWTYRGIEKNIIDYWKHLT